MDEENLSLRGRLGGRAGQVQCADEARTVTLAGEADELVLRSGEQRQRAGRKRRILVRERVQRTDQVMTLPAVILLQVRPVDARALRMEAVGEHALFEIVSHLVAVPQHDRPGHRVHEEVIRLHPGGTVLQFAAVRPGIGRDIVVFHHVHVLAVVGVDDAFRLRGDLRAGRLVQHDLVEIRTCVGRIEDAVRVLRLAALVEHDEIGTELTDVSDGVLPEIERDRVADVAAEPVRTVIDDVHTHILAQVLADLRIRVIDAGERPAFTDDRLAVLVRLDPRRVLRDEHGIASAVQIYEVEHDAQADLMRLRDKRAQVVVRAELVVHGVVVDDLVGILGIQSLRSELTLRPDGLILVLILAEDRAEVNVVHAEVLQVRQKIRRGVERAVRSEAAQGGLVIDRSDAHVLFLLIFGSGSHDIL